MFNEKWNHLSIPQKMDKFFAWFPSITKEESDYIESILKWDEETRSAFFFAKRMFEEPHD